MRIVVLGMAALLGLGLTTSAQSGRNRERPPAPQPQPQPAPQPGKTAKPDAPPVAAPPVETPQPKPSPVPQGGGIAKQENAGAITRSVLRNGTRILVRENPASPVVALRLSVRGVLDVAAARSLALARHSEGSATERLRNLGGEVSYERTATGVAFTTMVSPDAVVGACAALAGVLDEGPSPDTALLVVVGPVIPYNVVVACQHAFGGYSASSMGVAAPPAPVAPSGTAVSGLQYQATRADSGIALVTITYAVPKESNVAAMGIAGAALADGMASRLGRSLRSSDIGADVSSSMTWLDVSVDLTFAVVVDARKLDAAEAAFFREIDRFRRERMSDGELQRARNTFDRTMRQRLATADGEAAALEQFEIFTGDIHAVAAFLDRARGVSSADIQLASAKLLVATAARVAETLPLDAPARNFTAATFADTVAAWAPTSGRDVASTDVKVAEGPAVVAEGAERRRRGENDDAVLLPVPLAVRDFSTLNGPKAFVREDQSQPLLSIGFLFPAGRAAEPATERGVTELLLRTMVRGSRKYPGDRLAWAVEQLGGRMRIVNEADFFGLVFEIPSRNAEQLFPIAADVIQHPALEKEDVLHERDILLARERLVRADEGTRSLELFWQSRFPGHAYGAPMLGVPDQVAKLTPEQVRDWYQQAIRSTFPLVAIVGDTDGSSLISRFVAEGFDRPDATPAPVLGLPAPAAPTEAVETHDVATTTQTDGFAVAGGVGPQSDALDVALAAVASRVTADLDDQQGTLVAIRARVDRRRLAGAAVVTAASSPANENRVRDVVTKRFASVASTRLTDAELRSARALATSAALGARQAFTDMLIEYVRDSAFGIPLDTAETYAERSRAVTAEAVQRAAAAFNFQLAGRGVVRGH